MRRSQRLTNGLARAAPPRVHGGVTSHAAPPCTADGGWGPVAADWTRTRKGGRKEVSSPRHSPQHASRARRRSAWELRWLSNAQSASLDGGDGDDGSFKAYAAEMTAGEFCSAALTASRAGSTSDDLGGQHEERTAISHMLSGRVYDGSYSLMSGRRRLLLFTPCSDDRKAYMILKALDESYKNHRACYHPSK